MNFRIGAAIIGYNDRFAVKRLLTALHAQSFSLTRVFLIDNSEEKIEIASEEYAFELNHLHSGQNIGVAAGVHEAVDWARSNKLDWLWMFDQDSIPDHSALFKLVDFLESHESNSAEICALTCKIIDRNSGSVVPGYYWSGERFQPIPIQDGMVPYECDAAINSGMLLKVESLIKEELPSYKLFIDGVDFDLCFRLRRRGLKIFVIPEATLLHELGSPTLLNIPFTRIKKEYFHLNPIRIFCICRNYTHLELKFASTYRRPKVILNRVKHALYFIFGSLIADDKIFLGVSAAITGTIQGLMNPKYWPAKPPFLKKTN